MSLLPHTLHAFLTCHTSRPQVFAYDLDRMASTWQALLHSPVMTVSQVPSDPHLILARVAAPSNQFTVFDIRSSKKGVILFGYDLARASCRSLSLPLSLPHAVRQGLRPDPVRILVTCSTHVRNWRPVADDHGPVLPR